MDEMEKRNKVYIEKFSNWEEIHSEEYSILKRLCSSQQPLQKLLDDVANKHTEWEKAHATANEKQAAILRRVENVERTVARKHTLPMHQAPTQPATMLCQ